MPAYGTVVRYPTRKSFIDMNARPDFQRVPVAALPSKVARWT
jgi:hypothetical protein